MRQQIYIPRKANARKKWRSKKNLCNLLSGNTKKMTKHFATFSSLFYFWEVVWHGV